MIYLGIGIVGDLSRYRYCGVIYLGIGIVESFISVSVLWSDLSRYRYCGVIYLGIGIVG